MKTAFRRLMWGFLGAVVLLGASPAWGYYRDWNGRYYYHGHGYRTYYRHYPRTVVYMRPVYYSYPYYYRPAYYPYRPYPYYYRPGLSISFGVGGYHHW